MLFIKNGKCEFGIAYNVNRKTAEFSANELAKYVEIATGNSVNIIPTTKLIEGKNFYIGFCKDEISENELKKTDLNGDGFILDITDGQIYLNAKVDRGLIYGVYRFLETFLDVRFFNTDCERTPFFSELDLPIKKIIEKPAFYMRSYLNKMLDNTIKEFDGYYLKQKMCNEHKHLPENLGGECPMYGRGGTHNMVRFVPQEKYFESHPEFYAVCERYTTIDLLNGITDDGKIDETMDVSVIKIVIEEMKKDIIANPNAVFFQFEQEDSDTYKRYEEGSHQAEILAKYGRSGILVRFCNILATELQKWADKELNGRKIYIVTFAYSYAKEPPVVEKDGKLVPIDDTVIAVDNLIIRQAFFANCAWDYFDEMQDSIGGSDMRGMMEGWRVVAKRFFFWAYDTDHAAFTWYFPSLRNIRRNIDGFKKYGVEYMMFESADYGNIEWQADLKCYIYSNLMWNPNQDINVLYNEYLENYFGPAADYVKRASALLENYSTWISGIYDNYIVCTFRWTYRHVDIQNERLFDRAIALLEEGERQISLLAGDKAEYFSKHLAAAKVTFYQMKMNKVIHHVYQNVAKSGVTRFSGCEDIPPVRKQSFFNVEMQHGVKVPVIIPDDVKKQVEELDVFSISDQLDLENTQNIGKIVRKNLGKTNNKQENIETVIQ
ncbi:MAG: DUF4838 domain-containing protein [Clostridiales bacterium]|nr:DUF4838 domain-containing protein [Clostridiales bacterium]